MLASQVTPEHGDIALDGIVLRDSDTNSDALYDRGNVSYALQVNQREALTPRALVKKPLFSQMFNSRTHLGFFVSLMLFF
jgi:hypothetical protein